VDPWYSGYYDDLMNDRGVDIYLRAKDQLLELAGGAAAVRDKVVMDAGSGFGLVSNLMATWGARRVIALELFPPMSQSHRIVLDRFFPHLRDRIWLVNSDVKAMPVATASVDLLLSIEAISHYYEVDAFLDECARVIRPGGVLLISDGNNGGNPSLRRSTEQLWVRHENGPPGPFGDRKIGDSMLSRRERIIAERFPQLDADRAKTLAMNTSGMSKDELVAAVSAHLAGGPAPASPYRFGTPPRDPDHGYLLEALFDPPALARDIAKRGFDARAVPHYGGANNDVFLAANRVLRTIPSFRYARAFRIVARRK
jgi:SAM-dependent methyltransferase